LKQKVFSGANHLPALTIYLNSKEIYRVLLITGKNSFFESSASALIQPCLQSLQATVFNDFSQNPKIEDVQKGIEVFKATDCQAIIAIGGGSVLDMAKLIRAYHDYDEQISSGITENKVGKCDSVLIAMPTTAGSGSEATQFAVVYIDKKKYSVSNSKLKPELVFLIPELTFSMTPYLTAVTGLDAITQAIESFWSINSTDESRALSISAIHTLWKYLPAAVHRNDKLARTKILTASHEAGKAINIAKTTAAHAISYSFTTYHGIPHGHAVALTIPFFCGYNYDVTDDNCMDVRGVAYVKGIISEILEIIGESELQKALISFISNLGLNLYVPASTAGIENDILRILSNINSERMQNNPRVVQDIDIENMLKNIIIDDLAKSKQCT